MYRLDTFGILRKSDIWHDFKIYVVEIHKEESAVFKIVILITVIILAIGWIIYGIFEYKMRQEEKKHTRKPSERLQKTRSEVVEWAKKMAEFQPPKHKKPTEDDSQQTNEPASGGPNTDKSG